MPHPVQVALMVGVHPSMDIIGGNLQLHAPLVQLLERPLWRLFLYTAMDLQLTNECLISGWRLVHTPEAVW